MDDAGKEVAEGLPGPSLCDSHHVLQRTRLDCFPLVSFFLANYVFHFFVLFVLVFVRLIVCLFTCPVRARGQPCDWIGVGSAYPACLQRNTDQLLLGSCWICCSGEQSRC